MPLKWEEKFPPASQTYISITCDCCGANGCPFLFSRGRKQVNSCVKSLIPLECQLARPDSKCECLRHQQTLNGWATSRRERQRPCATKQEWGRALLYGNAASAFASLLKHPLDQSLVLITPATRHCRTPLALDRAGWPWTTCRTHPCTPGMSCSTDWVGTALTSYLVLLLNALAL